MDKADIQAIRAHLAACYPAIPQEAPRASRLKRFADLLGQRRTSAAAPAAPCPRPQGPPAELLAVDAMPISPQQSGAAAVPEILLLGELAPRRDAFGQRREPTLLDLWEPVWASLEGPSDIPNKPHRPAHRPLESEAPFFPGDLDDAPRSAAAKPPARAPFQLESATADPGAALLEALAAHLGREQRRIVRRLQMVPHAVSAANDGLPERTHRAMAHRAMAHRAMALHAAIR